MFTHPKPAPNVQKMHEAYLSQTIIVLVTKPELKEQLREVEKKYYKKQLDINQESTKISREINDQEKELNTTYFRDGGIDVLSYKEQRDSITDRYNEHNANNANTSAKH